MWMESKVSQPLGALGTILEEQLLLVFLILGWTNIEHYSDPLDHSNRCGYFTYSPKQSHFDNITEA